MQSSSTANNANVTDTESTTSTTTPNTVSFTAPVTGDGAKGKNGAGGNGVIAGERGGRGGGRGGRGGRGRGGLVDKSDGLPSYMLTPVSSMGTATITLEGEFIPGGGGPTQRPAKSASPTLDIGHVTRPTPSVRVTKLDNRPFVQVVPPPPQAPSGGVKRNPSSSLDSNAATTSVPVSLLCM